LEATSIDETIARDVLLGKESKTAKPDVVIVVIDATNLVRNLYLLSQLIENGCRIVVALTMVDLAKRHGLDINVPRLAELLHVPVVPVIARRDEGLDQLATVVMQVALDSTIADLHPAGGWRSQTGRTTEGASHGNRSSSRDIDG
jgi:ferrous iron transport protein B